MRKWYNTKESMGGYPSEIGDETAFVELDEAQAEIDKLKLNIKGWQQENTELQDEIDEWERVCNEHLSYIKKLKAEIDEALDRLWDMSLMDDGQAWKEAERFYAKYRDDWGKPKGE